MDNDQIQAEVAPLDPVQFALDSEESNRLRKDALLETRRVAYSVESDPLFFKWQRGEGTEQEWLDKVQEIRERFTVTE